MLEVYDFERNLLVTLQKVANPVLYRGECPLTLSDDGLSWVSANGELTSLGIVPMRQKRR